MQFGINLRGDLAKLDDAEIAARYEALVAEKVAQHEASPPLVQSKWLYRLAGWLLPGRGLFRARLFYKIQAVAYGIWVGYCTQSLFDVEAYLRECELKDVTDEIRRRLRRRPKSAAASVTP